jgi:hypothetical protein
MELSATQDILRLEIEKALRERAEHGGGCAYVSIGDYATRFGVSEADVLRDIAVLVDGGQVDVGAVEMNA